MPDIAGSGRTLRAAEPRTGKTARQSTAPKDAGAPRCLRQSVRVGSTR
ncbi:Outer membrane protein assembly factor BamB, contains PQQ-like beta-propeller repeat OS=Streptomyces microflavus OX=1919 GN=Smic_45150 PE=4 SV=1 [Streptomyces microflavus]